MTRSTVKKYKNVADDQHDLTSPPCGGVARMTYSSVQWRGNDASETYGAALEFEQAGNYNEKKLGERCGEHCISGK